MRQKMTLEQKRALLDSFGGKIWSVEWVKGNGELRKACCKHFIHSKFAQGQASKAEKNTVAHLPKYYSACDLGKDEAWVNIDLNHLRHVKCGSVEIEFEDQGEIYG